MTTNGQHEVDASTDECTSCRDDRAAKCMGAAHKGIGHSEGTMGFTVPIEGTK